jgi:peroxiredoxin Q/BCP
MNLPDHLWFILFLAWGLPLAFYRGRFRKIVYRTSDWKINIKPLFMKEIRALMGNTDPDNKGYLRYRNFYRFYLTVYFVLFGLYLFIPAYGQNQQIPSMQKIEQGSIVPSFTLNDQNGQPFDLGKVIGQKNLVVYFYPKDDSPGCTKEACYFRDQFEVFTQADALIIGISGQSVKSHREFADKYHLSFTLLSDPGNKIRKQFGVPTNFFGVMPGRVTYIVNKEGIVVHIFDSQAQATKHVDEAMRILKEIE